MVSMLQILLGLILAIALAQVLNIVKPSRSKITVGWLASALLIVLLSEYFLYSFIKTSTEQTIFLGLVIVSLLANLIKFTFGYIQQNEITMYNRFEHFMVGVILFYAATLGNIISFLDLQTVDKFTLGLIIVSLVNLISVMFEISELAIDKIKNKKYLVGPGVHDTSFDLLMILLGSILGMIVWFFSN